MTRYRRGKARNANNQARRKGKPRQAHGPGRNSGTRARIRHDRTDE